MTEKIRHEVKCAFPTTRATFTAYGYRSGGHDHLALLLGEPADGLLVRIHSECLTGDVFESARCDCGPQLQDAMDQIVRAGHGLLIYLRGHEGRGIGLLGKLKTHVLQDRGLDTVDANTALGYPVDARDYRVAAAILADLGIASIRLLTGNPAKVAAIRDAGIAVPERVPVTSAVHQGNAGYLEAKARRLGHYVAKHPAE